MNLLWPTHRPSQWDVNHSHTKLISNPWHPRSGPSFIFAHWRWRLGIGHQFIQGRTSRGHVSLKQDERCALLPCCSFHALPPEMPLNSCEIMWGLSEAFREDCCWCLTNMENPSPIIFKNKLYIRHCLALMKFIVWLQRLYPPCTVWRRLEMPWFNDTQRNKHLVVSPAQPNYIICLVGHINLAPESKLCS